MNDYRAWMADRRIDRVTRRVEDEETTILSATRGRMTASVGVHPDSDEAKAWEHLARQLDRIESIPVELT